MEKTYNKKDPRITLITFQLEDGTIEIMPLGSFTFEYFMYFENKPHAIFTNSNSAPNNFNCFINEKEITYYTALSTTSRAGHSSGFYFYEQTVWKNFKKKNNLNYSYQSLNCINNIRWNFYINLQSKQIKSITGKQKAATWSEREIQDLFDLKFKNLKDTRRLLLDYKVQKGVLNYKINVKETPKFSSYFDLYYV